MSKNFSLLSLIWYALLASLLLSLSSIIGNFFHEQNLLSWNMTVIVQGVVFSLATLITLFIISRKNKVILKSLSLTQFKVTKYTLVAILTPFILVVLGLLSAYQLGLIRDIQFNLSSGVISAILLNIVTAFLYEAFPEEVFIRGLVLNELSKKFRFIVTIFLQPILFVCIATFSTTVTSFVLNKSLDINISYVILIFTFGIALQLYKYCSGSLWVNILFHLVYLGVTRYIASNGTNPKYPNLISFKEDIPGIMVIYLSFGWVIIGSILILSILALVKRKSSKI
ncbi:CPBP family intramembrane glutamic endopeptidase [Mammaliicoccus sp. A-M4]|uniref:CPBP family intramembrane glutamic endopeptidase n=1 Tax=Mammaliicoccus sp. A-M4 TaxID=2898664 RepID=UPI001EFAE36F|nr:CPBP family intramembrane glutamic endopeptidase [Mammaliicoccus sp. A-M4]